jgi:hypothetical protein
VPARVADRDPAPVTAGASAPPIDTRAAGPGTRDDEHVNIPAHPLTWADAVASFRDDRGPPPGTPTLGSNHVRPVSRYGIAATGVAAALVAAPLPAMAAEDTDPNTGTVTITRFDDRYADGLFDPSKTARDGTTDEKRTSNSAWLVASDGTRHYGYTTADDDQVFENVPVGPATVYLTAPNNPAGEVFFDATGARSADEIERLPIDSYQGMASGRLSLTVDTDGEQRLVGMTALRAAVDVRYADGTAARGLTSVALGSGGTWYPATEYQFSGGEGTYEAFEGYGYVRHVPDEIGVRVTPPAGYRVASVTAADYVAIPVTQRDGAWWMPTTGAASYFSNPTFTVTLEPIPDTTRPTITVKEGPGFTTRSGDTYGVVSFKLFDAGRVDEVEINGTVKDLADNVWSDVNSVKPGVLGAVEGRNTIVVRDVAGNETTLAFRLDGTGPQVTVKEGATYTRGDAAGYDLVSFKLHDPAKVDRVVINGTVKDLTDNAWSDVNSVKPGMFGAVRGVNTLVASDVLGNTTTVTFTLR